MKNWPTLSRKNKLYCITSVWKRSRPTFATVPITLVRKREMPDLQQRARLVHRKGVLASQLNAGLSDIAVSPWYLGQILHTFWVILALEKYAHFSVVRVVLCEKTKYQFAAVGLWSQNETANLSPLFLEWKYRIYWLAFLYQNNWWTQMEMWSWFVNSLRWPVCYERIDADETEVGRHWRSSCRKTGGN